MWYAILLGLGLALGLAMMIWALRERTSRQAAETKAAEATKYREIAEEVAKENSEAVGIVKVELKRHKDLVEELYKEIDRLKGLLLKGDPAAIKEWLKDALGKETI